MYIFRRGRSFFIYVGYRFLFFQVLPNTSILYHFPAGLVYHSFVQRISSAKMRGLLLFSSLLAAVVNATVIAKRSVGASTPLSSKSKICNVLDYGGIADGKTDLSTAIRSAFTKCVSGNAATLYVPAGKYSCMVDFQSNLAISSYSI